jgi:uncharacterized metal-binding protein
MIAPVVGLAAGYGAATLGEGVGLQDGFRACIACMLGMAATLAVNPDLDLLESSFKSKARKKFLLLPWWILWMPYSVSFRHRSPYSHAPILGTLIRILYLLVIISLALSLLVIAGFISPEEIKTVDNFPRWFFLWFIAGMVASDTFHWFLDTVAS